MSTDGTSHALSTPLELLSWESSRPLAQADAALTQRWRAEHASFFMDRRL